MSGGSVREDVERPGTYLFTINAPATDGRRRQIKRRGFATKREARKALDDLRSSMNIGRGVTPTRITLGAFLTERWLPSMEADARLKPTTKVGYRRNAAHLSRNLGAVRLEALRGDDLDRLYGTLRAQGRSESLCRGVHVVAHKALGAAVRWRLVGFNAADDATPPAQTPPDPRSWSADQVRRFLDVAEGDRWAALWRLAATTGMRRGELVGLRWCDVDLDRQTVTVANNITVADHELHHGSPKSSRPRSLRLDPRTTAALRAARSRQAAERLVMAEDWPDHDLVFTWPDGSVVHPNVITRAFKRLAERAGLPPLRLHALRHSWATNALEAGVDVKDVSNRLGHSSTRITYDIYVAPSSDRDAAAAMRVAALYDSGP